MPEIELHSSGGQQGYWCLHYICPAENRKHAARCAGSRIFTPVYPQLTRWARRISPASLAETLVAHLCSPNWTLLRQATNEANIFFAFFGMTKIVAITRLALGWIVRLNALIGATFEIAPEGWRPATGGSTVK